MGVDNYFDLYLLGIIKHFYIMNRLNTIPTLLYVVAPVIKNRHWRMFGRDVNYHFENYLNLAVMHYFVMSKKYFKNKRRMLK